MLIPKKTHLLGESAKRAMAKVPLHLLGQCKLSIRVRSFRMQVFEQKYCVLRLLSLSVGVSESLYAVCCMV